MWAFLYSTERRASNLLLFCKALDNSLFYSGNVMIHGMEIVMQHTRGSTCLPQPQLLDGFLFLEYLHRIRRWIPLYKEFFPSKFSVPYFLLLLPQLNHTDKPHSLCYANFSAFSLCLNLHFV